MQQRRWFFGGFCGFLALGTMGAAWGAVTVTRINYQG